MLLVIILATLGFLFISFTTNVTSSTSNPIIAYISLHGHTIWGNLFAFIVIGAILITAFVFSKHKHAKSWMKRIRLATVQTGEVLILGFLLSFVMLYVIAVLQMNIFSVLMHINPSLLGVVQDQKAITNVFKSNDHIVKVMASNSNQHALLAAVSIVTAGPDNFYGRYVLNSIPGFLVIPSRQPVPLMLVDDTLIVTSLNSADLKAVSPALGSLMVKQYFQTRAIRSYPKFDVMSTAQYLQTRQKDSTASVSDVDSQITRLDALISSISAQIVRDKAAVASSQEPVQQAYKMQDLLMRKCNSSNVYHTGTIYDSYPKSECGNLLTQMDTQIAGLNKALADHTNTLKAHQDLLSEYKSYEAFFGKQKIAAQTSQKKLPQERGIFEAPDTIKMILQSNDPHTVGDYLETLVHEYLHYASYTKNKSLQDSFFEEGLTEYFARQIINYNLGISTNLGYPVHVKIIAEMANKIPESDLADIYFTKDQKLLETTLDSVYGDGFYARNRVIFEALQYTTDPQQTLQLANKIMLQIGGTPLTKKDLYSKSTRL